MGTPFNKRIINVERRTTASEKRIAAVEARMAKLDHALNVFWNNIPVDQRMELISKVEGKDEEE